MKIARRKIAVAVAVLAALGCLIVGGTAWTLTRPAARAPRSWVGGCPSVTQLDVRSVIRAYVLTAVARNNAVCSYRLTSPATRARYTKRVWASGFIPVVPVAKVRLIGLRHFQNEYGDVVPYFEPTPQQRQYLLDVFGVREGGTFWILLDRIGGEWFVSSWVPAGGATPA